MVSEPFLAFGGVELISPASPRLSQRFAWGPWWVGVGLLSGVLVLGGTVLLAENLGDALTRSTIRLCLAWYAGAVGCMVWLLPPDWSLRTELGMITRWAWTWAMLYFMVHLAVALHFFDGWSQTHAFERTRLASGYGEGLYVSYLFALGWLADVTWWWWSPTSFAARGPWLGRVWHAFMLFIVFNGTVVFETGAIRWWGVLGFTVLALNAGSALRYRNGRRADTESLESKN